MDCLFCLFVFGRGTTGDAMSPCHVLLRRPTALTAGAGRKLHDAVGSAICAMARATVILFILL